MPQKDAIVVHSGFIIIDKKLDNETRARVDRGLELLANNAAPIIIMNGGPGVIKNALGEFVGYLPRGTRPTHADLMKEYAVERGVPSEQVLTQDFSVDTIGEILFNAGVNLIPRGLRKVVAVSSAYHGPRILTLAARMYGSGFHTEFVGTDRAFHPLKRLNEFRRIERFLTDYADIPTGALKRFENALYERHKLYQPITPQERLTLDYEAKSERS